MDVELFKDMYINLKNIKYDIEKFEEETLFTEINDTFNAFMDIQAGSGGIDAQDWVEILLKMYTNWIEKKNFKYNIMTISYGDTAGIKLVSLKIIGKYAFGWLKNETGIHRLVRKSQFDSNNKRHTSFASVFIYPENTNTKNISIEESDLKIETFRSSGAGGQHVNKTDSAVRIVHLPSKIIVQCQSERSQHKNKLQALEQLKLKINALKNINISNKNESYDKLSITWGNQIRSYVLDKSYVKDLRTNQEINDISFILNGNLDIFILSLLKLS